jgi:hypothetical protein
VSPRVRIRVGAVKFYPDEPGLFVRDPDGPVFRDLERRMTRSQHGAQRMVGVSSGRLLSTIRKQRSTYYREPAVLVLAGSPRTTRYLMAHHDGSHPHIIRARRRRALRFTAGGKVIFRTSVRHPGTRGTFFLTRALPLAGG